MRTKEHKVGEKGSVLIAVLAIISLLAFLTTKFIDDSVKDLEYQALFKQPTDFRALAYNTLEITLAVIHEIATIDDGNIHHYEQGWQNPLQYFKIPQKIKDNKTKFINPMSYHSLKLRDRSQFPLPHLLLNYAPYCVVTFIIKVSTMLFKVTTRIWLWIHAPNTC